MRKPHFLLAPLAMAAALAVSIGNAAHAQAPSSAAVNVAIPAQPLGQALNELARQANLQLSFPVALVTGKTAPAVSGNLSVRQALDRLLAGSGLVAEVNGPEVIVREALPASSGDSSTLAPVTVTARAGAPGDLPAPYAGGQVARGGRVGLLGNRDFMDTPFNQTSFTAELIENQQARSLGDVVANDPSVFSPEGSGGVFQNFNIRGLGINNQGISFGGLYGLAPTDNGFALTESFERVEILKGPSALLNGINPAGNLGGTINLVPKRAGDEPLTRFTPSYATDSQLGGHLDVGRRFGDDKQFGIRFNGVYRDGDTPIDRQSEQAQLAALALDFRGERVRLSADLGHQEAETRGLRRSFGIATGVPVPRAPRSTINWSQPWMFTHNKQLYGVLRGEVDIADNATAYAAFGKGRRDYAIDVAEPSMVDALGTLDGTRRNAHVARKDTSTMEAGLRASLTTGFVQHQLALAYTTFRSESGFSFGSSTPVPDSNLYNPIFFPRPDWSALPGHRDIRRSNGVRHSSFAIADTLSVLDERVQLTVGVRRQRVASANFDTTTGARTSGYEESAWSPAAGLIVKPTDRLSLYANYIQGLQQGTVVGDRYANAGEVFPPYKTKQYEAGLKYDFGRLAATFSAFQIAVPSTMEDPATNVLGLDGEQRNRGLEFSAFGELARGLRVLGGVAYTDARLTKTPGGANDGKKAAGVPTVRATLGAEWDVPFLPGLTLNGRVIHTGSMYIDTLLPRRQLPAWTTLDLGMRYAATLGRTPVTLRADLKNVFDKSYWASSAFNLGTPRTLLLSAAFDF